MYYPYASAGGVLHLLRDSVDVVRIRQEVLEELEQALPDGPAER